MNVDTLTVSSGPRPVAIEVVRGALTRLSLLSQTLSGAHQGAPERYAETFAETLGDPLRHGAAPVTCLIENGGVHYAGSEVSGNDLVIRSIVKSLEDEGVSSITLLPGIPREELIELVHLLARPGDASGTVGAVPALGAKAWSLHLSFVHFETRPTRLVNEADEQVRPVELISRLSQQLGVGSDTLEMDTYIELAATLAGVRAVAAAPAPTREEGPAPAGKWERALKDIRAHRDVPAAMLSLVATESLRAAVDSETVTATATVWLERVQQAFDEGNPSLAASMLRPILMAADAEYRPVGFDATPVWAALRTFFQSRTRNAIANGIRIHPQTDDWVRVLFSLGNGVTGDSLLDFASIGRDMAGGPIREALGDGLAAAIDRIRGPNIRDLLAKAPDDALPVVLQAARRFTDPTLIEPLLARMRHESPHVREAALLALRAQQSPRIKAAARESIADPHRSVRLEALRYVSVYRDTDSVPAVADRVAAAVPSDTDTEELRALAIAWLHTSRGSAIPEIERTACAKGHRHPELPAACILALTKAGAPGQAALDRLGRSHESLRPLIREHSAPKNQERRP